MANALLIRGHEIPADKPLFRKRLASEGEKPGWLARFHHDLCAGLEYDKTIRAIRTVLPDDLDCTGDDEDRSLDMLSVDPVACSSLKLDLCREEVREGAGR